MIRNTSANSLNQALKEINKKYNDNIEFLTCESTTTNGKTYRIRFRVKDSKKAGARRGQTGRRLINACWHAHGHFFEELP